MKYLHLKVSQLVTHPKNMRRFYPANQVQEMAASILASKGVLQALVVTKGEGDKYVVVDGNLRLAGAKHLEGKCPPLECKVVDQDQADQVLTMVTANQIRYDVDAVSEGLHYKALMKEGLSAREISKRTGIYEARIWQRVPLADLEEPIQHLIVEGKLPTSMEVAKALLRLTPAVRVKLATRLGQNPNVKIKTILKACDSLMGKGKAAKKMKRPAVELAGLEGGKNGNAKGIRKTMEKVCHSCNQYEGAAAKALEPAWSLVIHKADETCNGCSLKEIQNVCGNCPAVELLRSLVKGDA